MSKNAKRRLKEYQDKQIALEQEKFEENKRKLQELIR